MVNQKNVTLSQEQVETLISNLGRITTKQIAKNIGITYGKLRNNLKVMGLKHIMKRRPPNEPRQNKILTLTPEQVDYATANYGKMPIAVMAKNIGVGYMKLINNLKMLGVHKEKKQQEFSISKKINSIEVFDVDQFARYYEY